MGGVKKCAVCHRSEKLPGVRLFSFPRQKYRCDQWLQKIGNPELYKFSTYRLSVAYKVCEQHFERNCFFSDMLNRLVRDAVPTLFGPNVKQHLVVDSPVFAYQHNTYSTNKLQNFGNGCPESEDCSNESPDRISENIHISSIDDLSACLLLEEDVRLGDKSDEINCSSEELLQDLCGLNSLSVGVGKFDHASSRQDSTHKDISLDVVDEMREESDVAELVESSAAHLAYRTEVSSPIVYEDEVSVEGFAQEGFLNSWMVDESVLSEDDNTSALLGKICERVNEKDDLVQDIVEVGMSFNEVSGDVAAAERNLEEDPLTDYMDVGSIHELDQSEFLQNWMPSSSLVDDKVNSINDRIDKQQCALSDMTIELMGEERERDETDSVEDITVCDWESEKISPCLPKLSHDNNVSDICQQGISEPGQFESIFLFDLSEEALPDNSRPKTANDCSDMFPTSCNMPSKTVGEDLFQSQKLANKWLTNLSDASKYNFQKAVKLSEDMNNAKDSTVSTIGMLPSADCPAGEVFPAEQVVQPGSGGIPDKLCEVTYIADGIEITETILNTELTSCDMMEDSTISKLSSSITCNDRMSTMENVTSSECDQDVPADVTDLGRASPYVLHNFKNMCRLCLATDEVVYSIFGDSNTLAEKDVVSCIPVNVQEEDLYPKLICRRCHDQMVSWFRFKQVCFKSQSILQQLSIGTHSGGAHADKQERNAYISLPEGPGQEKVNVISRSTQTVPILELLIGEQPLTREPGMVYLNKENDVACQKSKRKRSMVHKKKKLCDVKVRRAREIVSNKRNVKRSKNILTMESSCSPSNFPSFQSTAQNKMVNVMKQVHFSGLKPGCQVTVADKRYLIVGTKSGTKSIAGLCAKQHFCHETNINHTCKTELPT